MLFTDKWHVGFRLVPKVVTLNDLGQVMAVIYLEMMRDMMYVSVVHLSHEELSIGTESGDLE